jgi:hypothetical protein
MRCLCGCGTNIELLVVLEAKPRWEISIDAKQRPTLRPSVWVRRGYRSHFWLVACNGASSRTTSLQMTGRNETLHICEHYIERALLECRRD